MAKSSYGSYHYTVNGEVFETMREVNAKLGKMKNKPTVLKYEFFRSASKPSIRTIQVSKKTSGIGFHIA